MSIEVVMSVDESIELVLSVLCTEFRSSFVTIWQYVCKLDRLFIYFISDAEWTERVCECVCVIVRSHWVFSE